MMFCMSAKRDSPGPDHKPEVSEVLLIDGVITETSPIVSSNEDNLLTEIYRPEWVGVFERGETIEHIYTVFAPTGGIRKEWYYHEHTTDRYIVLKGELKLGLYDGRKDSKTYGGFTVISLGESGSGFPNAIRIPPLVWHSLKWESDQGMFMVAKLPGYQRESPDKFRVSPENYPEAIIWNI